MVHLLKSLWIAAKAKPLLCRTLSILYGRLHRNRKRVRGKGNRILKTGAFLKNVTFDIVGNHNTILLRNTCRISDTLFHIRGNGHTVEIGEECIYAGGSLTCEDNLCRITVGPRTFVGKAHIAALEPGCEVVIGEDCLISSEVFMRTSDSHSILDTATNHRINFGKSIRIGNHIWIGSHVTILKGVEIGENAVIGLGSVVTRSVPGGSIAVGSPARIIRSQVTWCHQRLQP